MHLGTSSWLLVVALLLPSSGVAQDLSPKVDHEAVARATAGEPLVLRARIVSATGQAIAEPTALVRLPGVSGFTRLPMKFDPALKDLYVARLPGAHVVADLDYFIEAFDEDGNGPGRAGSAEAPFHVSVAAVAPVSLTPAPATLAPTPATGRILVQTDPPGASISIDGEPLGASPIAHTVRAGVPHHLIVEAAGYLRVATEVTVLPNTDGLANLKLEKEDASSWRLLRLTAHYAFPGPFVGLKDDNEFVAAETQVAVARAYAMNLSFTLVLARHNGLTIDLGFGRVTLRTDQEGPDGDEVAQGSELSGGLGYQLLLGPFSVVRPHLGLIVGVRALSLEKGEVSLGWKGEPKTAFMPMVDPEIGIAFELPAHILLDLSARLAVLDYGGPLLQISGGLGVGAHF